MRQWLVRYKIRGTTHSTVVSAYNSRDAEEQVRAMFGSCEGFRISHSEPYRE